MDMLKEDHDDSDDITTSQQLGNMGKLYDINYKFSSYLNDKVKDTDYKLDTMGDYLVGYSEDPGRYIQRDYVLNALDHHMDKMEVNKQNLIRQITQQQDVNEGFVSGSGSQQNTTNYETFQIPTEEDDIMYYPQKPEDFYGDYQIRDGQYVLLSDMILTLNSTKLTIKNSNGNEILSYELSDIKPKAMQSFPSTTIEIDLNSTIIANDNQRVLDTPTQILAQKQKNLLYKLGLKSGKLYLFGSEAKYRLYNYNRTIMFHMKRVTTDII
jgi:hypothetical protein